MTTATEPSIRETIAQERWEMATSRPILYTDGSHTMGLSKRYERLTDDIRALAVYVVGELVSEQDLETLVGDVERYLKARVLQLDAETHAR